MSISNYRDPIRPLLASLAVTALWTSTLLILGGCNQAPERDENKKTIIDTVTEENDAREVRAKIRDRISQSIAHQQADLPETEQSIPETMLILDPSAPVTARSTSRGAGRTIGPAGPGAAGPAAIDSDGFYMGAGKLSTQMLASRRNSSSHNTETYDKVIENGFLLAKSSPLSTFSIDVDSASYSNVRRFLRDGSLPPAGAVRIEELINYFSYDYPQPEGDEPFSRTVELGACPWNEEHRLVHVGLKGRRIDPGKMPPRNLVFLLDVSGSMSSSNKLPLLKKAFTMLTDQLGEDDKISIVVYAGASGTVLPPTSGSDKQRILAALANLSAGGSTNGAAGIQLAYQTARENFQVGAINRVILATDGDFNVGTTSQSQLIELIEKERESGIFLTVLGLGRGNLKDSTMEKLADHGNGNYAYLDSLAEARKVLVKEAGGTLVTIAKDVKIQIEFNPRLVKAYRLIGYENRMLKARDFADDRKDAGEIGAGHTVTALYEIVPVGAKTEILGDPELRYQTATKLSESAGSDELLTLKLRYKAPLGTESKLIQQVVKEGNQEFVASDNFEFSASVAMFGMLLRNSEYKGSASYAYAKELAQGSLGDDAQGYRAQFLEMVGKAASLSAGTR